MMDFGIAVMPGPDTWKVVKRAEELGFSHVWFYDSQLLCADIFVAMAVAAVNSSRIKLATGVIIPSNRLAPVTANALASLNRLAPGRIIGGFGTGHTGRRTMGLAPMKLADVREYIQVVRQMLKGEMVEATLEGKRRKIQFMAPELEMINLADSVPIHISAFQPKARALAAEIADGFINAWVSDRTLADVAEMRDLIRATGRDPASCYMTCLNQGCLLEPGEPYDSPRAKAQAGSWPAIGIHSLVEEGDKAQVPPSLKPLVDEYRVMYERYEPADARYLTLHRGHLMYLRADEERFIGPELIRNLTLTGTEAEIRERIEAIWAAGYDQVAVQLVPGHEHAIEDWARFISAEDRPRHA